MSFSGANSEGSYATSIAWETKLGIERVVLDFEMALKSGCTISIRELLEQHSNLPAALLFRILLETELDYRAADDELPEAGEYLDAFPEFAKIVEQSFRQLEQAHPVSDRTTIYPGIPSKIKTFVAAPSDRMGRFEILDFVGSGAMGTVYRVEDTSSGEILALKILHAFAHRNGVTETQLRRQFHAETVALAELRHPHIVPVVEVGESQGMPFYTMPLIEGTTMRQLVEQAPIDPRTAAELIAQAALALHEAHRAGVIHRDIKPSNLLLDTDGQLHVADFGLALTDENFGTGLSFAGTPRYMSPEQAGGDSHLVDGRSDIFSLGVVLYELLTGSHPFDSPYSTTTELLERAARLPRRPLRQRVDIPESLETMCLKAIAAEPTHRYPTALDFAEDLTSFCKSWSSDPAPCLPHNSSQNTDVANKPPVGRSTTHRFRRMIVATLFTVVAAVTMTAWLRPDEEARQPDRTNPSLHEENRSLDGNLADKSLSREDYELAADHPIAEKTTRVEPAVNEPSIWKNYVEKLVGGGVAADEVWALFAASEDNTLRTALIHRLPEFGLPAQLVIARLGAVRKSPTELAERRKPAGAAIPEGSRPSATSRFGNLIQDESLSKETNPSARAALLLMLGEFSDMQLDSSMRAGVLPVVLELFEHDPEPSVHAASEWLARRWNATSSIERLRPHLQLKSIPFEGGWYESLMGQTMVVFPAPSQFVSGSPEDEPGRFNEPFREEDQKEVTIPYTFAVATKEVTARQYRRIHTDFYNRPMPDDPDLPYNFLVRWHDAAWFCNRLSAEEGIPPSEHCYELVGLDGNGRELYREKADALQLIGYRLPTDQEWEFVCRGGTATSRYFGSAPAWLPHYAHCNVLENPRPMVVGSLKPNDFGLFDMLGNVSEWMHEGRYISQQDARFYRYLRGGSAWTPQDGVRSAARYLLPSESAMPRMGIRVARTLKARPFDAFPFAVEIQVGPIVETAEPQQVAAENASDDREPAFETFTMRQNVCLGSWERGSVPARRFRIHNRSSHKVEVAEIHIGDNILVLTKRPSSTIAPGGTTELQIKMTEFGIGTRTRDVRFDFRVDGREFNRTIRLSGQLTGAYLQIIEISQEGVPPRLFDFSTVPKAAEVRRRFAVLNQGDVPLQVSAVHASDGFQVVGQIPEAELGYGKIDYFDIAVDTSSVGRRQGNVTVLSNDPATPCFEFPVRAMVAENHPFATPGVFRGGQWLFDTNRDGQPDLVEEFGEAGDIPMTGDWNGDGICDLGVCRKQSDGSILWLRKLRTGAVDDVDAVDSRELAPFTFGRDEDTPIVGDWNGDGTYEAGFVRPSPDLATLVWHLDIDGDQTNVRKIGFGKPGEPPVAGKWVGDRSSNLAVVVQGHEASRKRRVWKIHVDDRFGFPAKHEFGFNADLPVVGDWDGDGTDDAGTYRREPDNNRCVWSLDANHDEVVDAEIRGTAAADDIPVVLFGSQSVAE